MISEIIAAALTLTVTLITVFFTPIGTAWANRLLDRKPLFSAERYDLTDNLDVVIRPANSAGAKMLPLGIAVKNQYFQAIAAPHNIAGKIEWRFNLYTAGLRRPLLDQEELELQLFFAADRPSAPLRFLLSKRAAYLSALQSPASIAEVASPSIFVTDTTSLVRAIITQKSAEITTPEFTIDLPLELSLPHLRTLDVYDGRELVISDVHEIDMHSKSGSRILAAPRYAWVLAFEHCTSIRLRGLTLGHTEEGYCQGGVLKLLGCSKIELTDCELFGCGTVGVELTDCEDITIRNCRIHDCTYFIGQISSSRRVLFDHCIFDGNERFSAFSFDGILSDIRFSSCKFSGNAMENEFFEFSRAASSYDREVVFDRCASVGNTYKSLSGSAEPTFVECTFTEQKRS